MLPKFAKRKASHVMPSANSALFVLVYYAFACGKINICVLLLTVSVNSAIVVESTENALDILLFYSFYRVLSFYAALVRLQRRFGRLRLCKGGMF